MSRAGRAGRGNRVFALLYDRLGAFAERGWFGRRRARLLRAATGTVVEIGAGAGANLPHYGAVRDLVLTEPDPAMLRRLRPRARRARPRARVVAAPAERLPLADGAADTVVSTLVLCSVRDPAAALAEVRRVLAPGGRLVFLEHVRDTGRRGRVQDLVARPFARVAGGCHPNRDTLGAIAAAGLHLERLERHAHEPRWLVLTRPLVAGVARRPDR